MDTKGKFPIDTFSAQKLFNSKRPLALQDLDDSAIMPKKLYSNLALPSYVHGYTLAIEYMYNWFESKFDKDFFRGGIYIDGKHVLDDYKYLNDTKAKQIVKGENPRARMICNVDYDYDRESLDLYQAPPEIFLHRSRAQDAFFKDYERNLYLGFAPRALRMNCDYRVRLNSKAQQLDTFNKMEINFRNGSTQSENLSIDFHVPKDIMLDIATKAGFEVYNGEVVEIIEFLEYLNRHSMVTFLFKLRAINLKAEFFIRVNNVYTHISVRDKLQLDNGERDGKLDFNFHIDMNAVLTMPIPHYYAYYSGEPYCNGILIEESNNNCIAVYSIPRYFIPKVDENGWNIGITTTYQTDDGDTEIDLTALIGKNNPLARAIDHDFTRGVSPSSFINIKLIREDDIYHAIAFDIDWVTRKIKFKQPEEARLIDIAIYYDGAYIAEIEKEEKHLREAKRIESDPDHDIRKLNND